MYLYTSFTNFIAGIFAGLNAKENNGLWKHGGRLGFDAVEGHYSRIAITAPSRQSWPELRGIH
jgi:hypothetical protein